MGIANELRKLLNRPVRFDREAAMEDARFEAHIELNRMSDPSVVAEVSRWAGRHDPITDGVECDQDANGRRR